ncbi:MAG: hypothetical protein ACRDRX_15180 [Pseudonocardiaceae bacterium]
MVVEEQQEISVPQFIGPVISLGVGGSNLFFQIRDKATDRIRRFEVLGASFTDDTPTVGKRVQANMWFSLLRESFMNKFDVTIDPLPGFNTVVRSITVGEPFI